MRLVNATRPNFSKETTCNRISRQHLLRLVSMPTLSKFTDPDSSAYRLTTSLDRGTAL